MPWREDETSGEGAEVGSVASVGDDLAPSLGRAGKGSCAIRDRPVGRGCRAYT